MLQVIHFEVLCASFDAEYHPCQRACAWRKQHARLVTPVDKLYCCGPVPLGLLHPSRVLWASGAQSRHVVCTALAKTKIPSIHGSMGSSFPASREVRTPGLKHECQLVLPCSHGAFTEFFALSTCTHSRGTSNGRSRCRTVLGVLTSVCSEWIISAPRRLPKDLRRRHTNADSCSAHHGTTSSRQRL